MRWAAMRVLSAILLMLFLAPACSIKSQVPDFEYPETATRADWKWPRLGRTSDLEDRSIGQEEALDERAELDLTQNERADALADLEDQLNTIELDPEDLQSRAEDLRRKRLELTGG